MNKPTRLPPLNALRAFEAAARHLSFKKAARELHVTAGAVSHQVKLLEDHLGVPLFRRLTRALELTSDAYAMLPKVKEGLDALYAAVERVRAREAMSKLTVVCPPNFAARWLMPRLGRFRCPANCSICFRHAWSTAGRVRAHSTSPSAR